MPIVVVFTQFDLLVSHMEERLFTAGESEEDIESLCLPAAHEEFKMLCKDPIEQIIDKLKLPWVITSGLIICAFVVLFDIYIVSSAKATPIPIDFNGTYRCYSKSGGVQCGT